jgi:SAM-dependent methyltransferase
MTFESSTREPAIAEFTDPRLVAVYDTINPYAVGTQPAFYSRLAADSGATSIVDLGCGTGLMTCELAGQGYAVTGVDPSRMMLSTARERRYGERVRWIEGDAGALETGDADLAMMTGHVAQFLVSDASWHRTLTALGSALRPGGILAFEARNPVAREWERWNREARWSASDPNVGPIECWSEVHEVRDGIVSYANHYLFVATGEELVSMCRLRFRTEVELTRTLASAGFTVEHVYGDWDRRDVGPGARELIVVAHR